MCPVCNKSLTKGETQFSWKGRVHVACHPGWKDMPLGDEVIGKYEFIDKDENVILSVELRECGVGVYGTGFVKQAGYAVKTRFTIDGVVRPAAHEEHLLQWGTKTAVFIDAVKRSKEETWRDRAIKDPLF
jgi:hypothetical protein